MKILFATSSFQGGGITSYAHEVVNCLKENHKVDVLIENDDINPFDNNCVDLHRFNLSDSSSRNAKKLVDLINNVIKPDIVFNSNAKLIALISPFLKDNIRVISVSHSLRYIEADITGINHKYSDNIIALSNYNKRYLINTFGNSIEAKISVIYNSVRNHTDTIDDVLLKKTNSPILKIVYAGGTSAPKSPILVFKVLSKLLETDLDFEFFFLGNSTPTLKKVQLFKDISNLLPHDKRLHITGRVSRIEAERIISQANIFFVPSKREGCPMAMLEAMRFGCILITSDYNNACKEIVKEEYNGFIIPHNRIDLFVNRIVDIVKNHSNYIHIYEQCWNDFNENLSADLWCKHMNNLIELNKISHTRRFEAFSPCMFYRSVLMFKYREVYNKVHMLLFETLGTALSFAYINLKRNIGNVYSKVFK